MISKQKICTTIDKAADEIHSCWNILTELRNSKYQPPIANGDIVNFQKRLIGALWILDDAYREVHAERKRLIAAKKKFAPPWFKKRMAKLADYQDAIRHTISIAKAVGDGFAWIFYRNERKLIAVHLKSQRQVHLPPKIGRLGERAFIERFQVVDGKLVLYHGITTFLRMGDISFYDFAEHRISNIGEIKTEHIKGNEYRINLGFVYGGRFSPVIDLNKIEKKAVTTSGMLPEQAARMNRQLKQIVKALSTDEDRTSKSTSQQGHFYFTEFDHLIADSNTRKLKTKKVGDGLLLSALRLPGDAPLSKRLLNNKKFHVGKKNGRYHCSRRVDCGPEPE